MCRFVKSVTLNGVIRTMISLHAYKLYYFIIGFGVGSVYWFAFVFAFYFILKIFKGFKLH